MKQRIPTHVLVGKGKVLHLVTVPVEDWYGVTSCGLLYSKNEPADRYLWGRVMHTGYVEYTESGAQALGLRLCKTCLKTVVDSVVPR